MAAGSSLLSRISFYDDKGKQMELLQSNQYPAPQTAFVECRTTLIVSSVRQGYDSRWWRRRLSGRPAVACVWSTVSMTCCCLAFFRSFARTTTATCEWSLSATGSWVFAGRIVPAIFALSGSGLKEYLDDLDFECVRLAHRISTENNFESMSYDFVRDSHGRWVVLEFSYCFGPGARKCSFYYDLPSGEKRDKIGVYPEDFILADFLEKHPEVGGSATTATRPSRRSSPGARKPCCPGLTLHGRAAEHQRASVVPGSRVHPSHGTL